MNATVVSSGRDRYLQRASFALEFALIPIGLHAIFWTLWLGIGIPLLILVVLARRVTKNALRTPPPTGTQSQMEVIAFWVALVMTVATVVGVASDLRSGEPLFDSLAAVWAAASAVLGWTALWLSNRYEAPLGSGCQPEVGEDSPNARAA